MGCSESHERFSRQQSGALSFTSLPLREKLGFADAAVDLANALQIYRQDKTNPEDVGRALAAVEWWSLDYEAYHKEIKLLREFIAHMSSAVGLSKVSKAYDFGTTSQKLFAFREEALQQLSDLGTPSYLSAELVQGFNAWLEAIAVYQGVYWQVRADVGGQSISTESKNRLVPSAAVFEESNQSFSNVLKTYFSYPAQAEQTLQDWADTKLGLRDIWHGLLSRLVSPSSPNDNARLDPSLFQDLRTSGQRTEPLNRNQLAKYNKRWQQLSTAADLLKLLAEDPRVAEDARSQSFVGLARYPSHYIFGLFPLLQSPPLESILSAWDAAMLEQPSTHTTVVRALWDASSDAVSGCM